MFYISFDLARQILEERRAQARLAAELRRARAQTVVPPREKHADVIELELGAPCETEQIGA